MLANPGDLKAFGLEEGTDFARVIALQFNRSAFYGATATASDTKTFREPLNERKR